MSQRLCWPWDAEFSKHENQRDDHQAWNLFLSAHLIFR